MVVYIFYYFNIIEAHCACRTFGMCIVFVLFSKTQNEHKL